MKVRLLEANQNLLRLEIEGEGHTLCNLLQAKLLEDDRVEIAGYDKHHPLEERAILYVRTKGEASPKEVLIDATDKALTMAEEFRGIFEKEISTTDRKRKQS